MLTVDRREGDPRPRVSGVVVAFALLCLATMATRDARAFGVVKAETGVSAVAFAPLNTSIVMSPDMACNASECLVAWVDTRVSYRVWARRIGADGAPRDPSSFLVSLEAETSTAPAVATDGTHFVIAWTDGYGNIFSTRVDPDGSRHTQTAPATVGGSISANGPIPITLAYGGGEYLAIYTAAFDAPRPMYARRIAADGHFLDAAPFTIAMATTTAAQTDVVWTGSQFVIVWNVQKGTSQTWVAMGSRMLANGTVVDATPFEIASLSGFSNRPQLAYGGNALLLVAGRTGGSQGGAVDALLLDANGMNATRLTLPNWSTTQTGLTASAVWDGSNFAVAWIDGPTNHQTVLTHISPAGAVDPAAAVLTSSSFSAQTESPSVGAVGATAFVAYVDRASPKVDLRLVTYNGAPGHQSDPPLTTAAVSQRLAATARGSQTLVVWNDEVQGANAAALLAVRIADDGTVLDAQPLVLSPETPAKRRGLVSAAFNSGVYLVTWWEQTMNGIDGRILSARVSPAGTLLDQTPQALATGIITSQATQVSALGAGFLVSWSSGSVIFPAQPPTARLVAADGTLGGAAFTLGPTQASWPYATLGVDATSGGVFAWTQLSAPTSGTLVGSLALTGVAGTGTTVSTQQSLSGLTLVRGATDVLLWLDGRAGLWLSPVAPFTVKTALVNLGREVGTPSWDGTVFAGAAGHTHGLAGTTGGVDLTFLSASLAQVGSVTALVDPLLPTSAPTAVGLGSGKSLIVYSRLMPDADTGNVRVRFQILDSQSSGGGGASGGAAGGGGTSGGGGNGGASGGGGISGGSGGSGGGLVGGGGGPGGKAGGPGGTAGGNSGGGHDGDASVPVDAADAATSEAGVPPDGAVADAPADSGTGGPTDAVAADLANGGAGGNGRAGDPVDAASAGGQPGAPGGRSAGGGAGGATSGSNGGGCSCAFADGGSARARDWSGQTLVLALVLGFPYARRRRRR